MLNSLPTHEPQSDWVAPEVSCLPSWHDAKRVAIDCETRDPDLLRLGPGVRRGASIVGVSFAVEDGPSYYLPVGHEAGGNVDRAKVFEYLKDQARSFRGDLAGANLSYDLDFLLQAGVDFRPRRFRDCLIAEPLLDENQFSYSLEAVASRRGLPGKEERGLRQAASAFGLDPKADLWRLHAKHVGPYAERDARLPLLLLRKQEREIEEQELETVWDLECRVLPVLVQMRRRGVRIDRDHIAVVEERCGREEVASMAEFSRLVGKRILPEDMNKAALVGPAIESATGQKLPRTPSGMFQVKMNLERSNLLGLDGLIHPAVAMYLRARRFNKCRTTFVESIREHAVGDRVHCSFNQMKVEREDGDTRGTVSGRLSSGDPNLQQQPNRDPEIGPLWRSIYLPEEGEEWACLDYSQQEPRWVVHFAERTGCYMAREAGDRYRANPALDNHQMVADMIGWPGKEGRKKAKGIYLGKIYGMGDAKFCRSVGLPTVDVTRWDGTIREEAGPEGRKMLDEFRDRAPFLGEVAMKAVLRAKEQHFVKTILGRRCRFEVAPNGKVLYTHKSLNRIVQGTSADQTKKAMVDAEDAGIPLRLQVHDELDLSVASREMGDRLAVIMRDAIPCRVPHLVEPKYGRSWGELK